VYLHQAPALFPGTVEDNLREPFGFSAHAGRPFPADRALGHLRRMGRGRAFLDRPVEDLSGGERQLTALVRAVLLEPRMLLLDEPTAALDPAATDEVEETVRRWLEEDEASRGALWVTHDAEQAGRVAHRRLELRGGRLRPPEEDRTAPAGTDGPAGDAAGGGRGEAAGTGGGGPAGTPGGGAP
jgi:putative ABC transport system ATP-binding protein